MGEVVETDEIPGAITLEIREQLRLLRVYQSREPSGYEKECAKDRLVRSFLNYVRVIAKRFAPICKSLTLGDLMLEGSIGVVWGLDRYDSQRGIALSTYLTYWIRQKILRAIAQQERPVRISSEVYVKVKGVEDYFESYFLGHGCMPSVENAATVLGLDTSFVEKVLNGEFAAVLSLSSPVGEDEETTFEDTLTSTDIAVSEAVIKREYCRRIRELLDTLPAKERHVIVARFGLGGGRPLTLNEVGDQLNVSRETVRNLQLDAQAKLRTAAARVGIRNY